MAPWFPLKTDLDQVLVTEWRSSARVDAYASLTRSVCQLVCQETAGGRDSGQIVKDSGEPKVRQLEPRR